MEAARSVLDSDEVKQALENHESDNPGNLTEEQQAYQEFIDSLDSKPESQ